MSLALIVGPPNSGRAGEIRARLEAALDRDPVLVVPTLDDADRFERELCTRDGARDSAVVGASIRTFRAFSEEIAAATGSELRPQLSGAQRLALVRAAVRQTQLEALEGSAARRGFAPALERLISELQSSLITPGALASAAAELEDGAYETELARLYEAYIGRRDAAGRDDAHSSLRKVTAGLLERPGAWGSRPVLLYGFDDLTEEQLELVAALTGACPVTVAVNYEDREALAPRAALLARLRDELGGVEEGKLAFDDRYTQSATLRHLDRHLFEAGATRVEPDDGIAMLECGGERGQAEAVGGEVARLLAGGVPADGIAVVLRHPDRHGPLFARVFEGFGIPVAVEASVSLARTAAGRGLGALARASLPEAGGEELLAFMRARPGEPQGIADWVERRLLRGEARTADELIADWKAPPWMLAALRDARPGGEWLRALAAAAHELAEEAHAGREPVEGDLGRERSGRDRALRAARASRRSGGRRNPHRPRRAGLGAGLRGPHSGRGARAARGRPGSAVAGANRGKGSSAEPVPGTRGPSPSPVRRLSPRRRVPRRRHRGSPAGGRAAAAPRHGGARPAGGGDRGALPVPRLRLPPDRAPVALLAELRRGGPPRDPIAVRGRGPRPARSGAR